MTLKQDRIRKILLNREKRFHSLCPPFVVQPNWVIVPDAKTGKRIGPVAEELGLQMIQIFPGFTYGSGGNELTRAALYEIPRLCAGLSREKARILDLGCGSGILALACARLGFRKVEGMDISLPALRQARANSSANGLRVKWTSQVDLKQKYDLIIANLFGFLFLDYLPVFQKILAQNGRIYAAGFDHTQQDELFERYESAGFERRGVQGPITRWTQVEWIRKPSAQGK